MNNSDRSDKIDDKIHDRMIYEFTIGNIPFILLIILITIRRCQTAHMAWPEPKCLSNSLKVKIVFTFIYLLFYSSIIFLSFFYEGFWLYKYGYYSLMYLLPALGLVYQISMFCFEYFRKLPLVWYLHSFFWITSFFCSLFFVINTCFLLVRIIFSKKRKNKAKILF